METEATIVPNAIYSPLKNAEGMCVFSQDTKSVKTESWTWIERLHCVVTAKESEELCEECTSLNQGTENPRLTRYSSQEGGKIVICAS